MWTNFYDYFETYAYETFLRRLFTEIERKVEVQNREFGWVRFTIVFLLLLNNDDKFYSKLISCLGTD